MTATLGMILGLYKPIIDRTDEARLDDELSFFSAKSTMYMYGTFA